MEDLLFGYNAQRDISIPVTEETEKRLRNAVFPAEYFTDSSCITAVKEQYVGNCWIFSTVAMMETFLLKSKLVDSSLKDNEKIFFETHMTYTEFDISHTPGVVKNPEGMTPVNDDYGGNRLDAASYFARNKNSVLEAIDPNFLTSSVSQLPERDNTITQDKFNDFEVSDIYMIEDPVVPGSQLFVDTIKYCVMTYGSVYLGFDADFSKFKEISTGSKYAPTISYYANQKLTNSDGHAVAIVGWDDNFSDFCDTPKSPGAFKTKNSWGTGSQSGLNNGDGYVWISYENVGFHGCYCIIGMKNRDRDLPGMIYTNSKFGIGAYLPKTPSATSCVFSDIYTAKEDDEEIVAVGLCTITPCLAAAELKINGGQPISLFKDQYLTVPGFHRIGVQGVQLGAKGTTFEITVTYKAVGVSATYIPLEYKFAQGFDNLDLSTVSGSIALSGSSMEKITDYKKNNKKYGNLPIYISTKWNSATAKDYAAAYKALTVPACSDYGLLGPLPDLIKPAGASASVTVRWLPEPNERSTYDASYKAPFDMLKIGGKDAMITKTDAAYELFMTAVIGNGPYAMKKKFTADIAKKKKKYEFSAGSVTGANKVTLQGEVSGIEGALIKISCNNVSTTVKTDANGQWKVSDFSLYNPAKDGGWQDSYSNSIIKVQVTDDSNRVLSEGDCTKKLERPFDLTDTVVTVVATLGAVSMVSGLAYCIYNGIKNCSVGTSGCSFMMDGFWGEAGVPLLGNGGNMTVNLNDAVISNMGGPLFDVCGDIQNASLQLDMDLLAANKNVPDKFAGIALTLASGRTCKNCSVTGKIRGGKSVGGLFCEGENVTIENCSVDLTVSDCDDFAAVAHTISGTSKLNNISAHVETSGTYAAGIAANLSGTVSQCSISFTAEVSGEAAGVCRNGQKASITNVFTDCSIETKGSDSIRAAAVAAQMDADTTLTNCIALGKIDAGTSGTAYGIAPGTANKPEAVSGCICALSFISGSGVFRISQNPGADGAAYKDIVNRYGGPLVSSGETLMEAAQLLLESTFTDRGFDMNNIWQFDSKKCCVSLRGFDAPSYRYPFPNPYPTKNGKYEFGINTELALYGAANAEAEKITWGGLSPENGAKTVSGEETQYMLNSDQFYLQAPLMITQKGQYSMDIISVIQGYKFSNRILIEIV